MKFGVFGSGFGIYFSFSVLALADPGQGLRPETPEEAEKLSRRRIEQIRPNERAVRRVNRERKKNGLPPIQLDVSGPEFEVKELIKSGEEGNAPENSQSGAVIDLSLSSGTTAALGAPAQVDNSEFPAFPAIGDQGRMGSCVAWATAYYQMSYEVCLALGCDNKNLATQVFSPKFVYPQINGGVDGGSYFSDANALLSLHGAAQLREFPYDADYLVWDLNSDHWRDAIQYRVSAYSSFSVNTDSGIAQLKQLLANGHIAVIGTYISNWNYFNVQNVPGGVASPFAGQRIVGYQSGTMGGHAMTVVGYDDSVWIDLNSNGIAEAAELGAFKIANSWGRLWGNGGFIWAAYDAFRALSAVPGFSPAGRNQLTQSAGALVVTYTPYQPKLLAKVTLSHAARGQLRLSFGASSNSVTSPQKIWSPFALSYRGGAYAFNGTLVEVPGTFYFDISSISSATFTDQLYYLSFSDAAVGVPLTVSSFEIVDAASRQSVFTSAFSAASVDASSGTWRVGNYTPDLMAPSQPTALSATVQSTVVKKGKTSTVSYSASLKWAASTDNVGVSSYRVYRNGALIGSSALTSFTNSSLTAGVAYKYEVSAVDAQGNESVRSLAATVTP